MSSYSNSLLPFNATSYERALESVTKRATILPVDIAAVWDPIACPADLLPWLAWALSVDTWDSDWPEATKRALIANSVQIHRTKGTVSAIERVMDALGVTAELHEWFDYGGVPHTFRLTAWANANLVPDAEIILNPVLYRTLQHSIDNVKPVRSHYDFRIGAKFGARFGFGSAGIAFSYLPIQNNLELTVGFLPFNAQQSFAFQSMNYVRVTMEPS